ncbi:MAG: hypothetical protein M0R66_04230 [Candidatus Omnitrophica bacterium]|nr:hypothetical protein [Candidatus Omnitrophota bacterium]
MKKIIITFLLVFILGLAVVVFNRNVLARFIIVNGIKKTCGLGVNIKSLNIGLPDVSISGLKIYNPSGFKDRLLADIPRVYVDFDLPAFFKKKVHLRKLELEIEELDVILNEQGKLNVNSLALLVPKGGAGKPPEVKIDTLMIKIDKVAYKGYTPFVGAKSGEFNLKIKETFHDVTNPSKVAAEILHKVLSRIGIENLANFDVSGAARKAIGDAGAAAQEAVEKSKQEALEKTKEGLKEIFPLGEQK